MLYILHGEDDFSLHQRVQRIKADLGDPEALAISTAVLDGRHVSLSELRDKCDTAPFLSSNRLVLVNGLLGRFEPKQSKSRSKKAAVKSESLGEWQGLASYTKRMPAFVVLVLIDGKVINNNPLLKKLSSSAKVEPFPLLRGGKLRAWIETRVKEEGGDITPEAVKLLAELIGGNLWALNGEIEKLILYAQERTIEENDVRQLTSYSQEASVFTLVDAILAGRIGTAQGILHRLYQEGVAPTYILAMITRQFRLIAQVKDMSPGLSHWQIQNKLGLKLSFALDKTLDQAKSCSLEHVKEAYNKFLETDLAIKTGKYNDELALELLVAELSASPHLSLRGQSPKQSPFIPL